MRSFSCATSDDTEWQPVTPEEATQIRATWVEKDAACTRMPLSSLPTAYHGFLDPLGELGSIPRSEYAAALLMGAEVLSPSEES